MNLLKKKKKLPGKTIVSDMLKGSTEIRIIESRSLMITNRYCRCNICALLIKDSNGIYILIPFLIYMNYSLIDLQAIEAHYFCPSVYGYINAVIGYI